MKEMDLSTRGIVVLYLVPALLFMETTRIIA